MTEQELKSQKIGFFADNKNPHRTTANNASTVQMSSPVGNSSTIRQMKAAALKDKMRNELSSDINTAQSIAASVDNTQYILMQPTDSQKERAAAVKEKMQRDISLSKKEWKEPTTVVQTVNLKEMSKEEIAAADKYQAKVYRILKSQKVKIKRAKQIKFAKQSLLRVGSYGLYVAKKAIKSDDANAIIAAPVTVAAEKIAHKLINDTKLGKAIAKPISRTATVAKSMTESDSAGGGLVAGVGSLVVSDVKNAVVNKVMGYGDWLNKKSYERSIRRSDIKTDKKIQKAMNSYGKNAKKVYQKKQFSKTQIKTYKGNVFLKYNGGNIAKNSVSKVAALKKLGSLIAAGGGGMVAPIVIVIVILFLLLANVKYPFNYTSSKVTKTDDEGNSYEEVELTEGLAKDVITHYHQIMNKVVAKTNADIAFMFGSENAQNIQDSYNYTTNTDAYNQAMLAYNQALNDWADGFIFDVPTSPDINDYRTENSPENSPIFEGYFWSDDTDGTSVPYKKLYNEMLAVIATNNLKQTIDSADGQVIFMDDETVESFYNSLPFWKLTTESTTDNCGGCRSKEVEVTVTDESGDTHKEKKTVYFCPGHVKIFVTLKLDFDISKIHSMLNFDENDVDDYEEVLNLLIDDLK